MYAVSLAGTSQRSHTCSVLGAIEADLVNKVREYTRSCADAAARLGTCAVFAGAAASAQPACMLQLNSAHVNPVLFKLGI